MPRRTRVTLGDWARLGVASHARIAPDGRRVAWVVSVAGGRGAIHVADARGRLLNVLGGPGIAAWDPAWMPDARHLVYVASRGGRDDLWRAGADGGKPEQLTQLDGRVRAPRVAPDGRRVAFVHAPRPAGATAARTRLVARADGLAALAPQHVWVLDIATGRASAVTSGDADDESPAWSPDGRRLAFAANGGPAAEREPRHRDIVVVPAAGGRTRALAAWRGPKRSPAWSPDGRWIAFLGAPGGDADTRLWVVPARGGTARDVTRGADIVCEDRLLGDARDMLHPEEQPPVWSADGRRLFFLATREGATNIWEVRVAGGAPAPRSHGPEHVTSLSQSRDGRVWAFARATATSPSEVFVAEPGRANAASGARIRGARVRRVSHLNDAWLARRALIEPQAFVLPGAGRHAIHGWALRALGRRPAPAVLMAADGPGAARGWSFDFESQLLAARGWHVFHANLRGSAGYGRDHARALTGRWGHADYEDLVRVAEAVERLPWVDAERMAIAGEGYGGYLTLWCVAHTLRFRCAASASGIANLLSLFGSGGCGWELRRDFEDQLPWESLDRYWRVSPLAYAHAVQTPILLVHADGDRRIPASQSQEMFTALRLQGRDVEWLRLPGDPASTRGQRLRAFLDWFARKL